MASYSDSGRRVLVLAIQCHRFEMKVEMSVTVGVKESFQDFLVRLPPFSIQTLSARYHRLGSRGNTLVAVAKVGTRRYAHEQSRHVETFESIGRILFDSLGILLH